MSDKLNQALAPAATQRNKEPNAYERFRAALGLVRKDLAQMLGGDDKVDKFIQVCLSAAHANPKILGQNSHTKKSLFLACLKAAQDGLVPDGREAVFNIYPTKVKQDNAPEIWVDVVQYLPMAYGLVQLIYRAGATYVDAVPVFEKDAFKYRRGDDPKIEHEPYGAGEPGDVIAAYCVVKLQTGETKREVMWKWEIDRVREKSKAKGGLMWKDVKEGGFYDQGAVKSVIHRIVKQLPRSDASAKLEGAVRHDLEATGIDELGTPTADVDLEALVDGRLDQEIRDAALKSRARPEQVRTGTFDGPSGGGQGPASVDAGGGGSGGSAGDPKVAVSNAPTKKGDKGTPEIKKRYLDAINASHEVELLALKMDEARDFVAWEPADLEEIENAYRARLAVLQGK